MIHIPLCYLSLDKQHVILKATRRTVTKLFHCENHYWLATSFEGDREKQLELSILPFNPF